MTPSGLPRYRNSPFSYRCNRCNLCCYGKAIPLNPYDLIRLSEVLGIGTGELIERYTVEGVALKNRANRSCVFLGREGCTVHSGRPGPCRIYPLGRVVNSETEYFCEVEPHPETKGEYAETGVVGDYIASQGVEPYFQAVDAYLQLYREIGQAVPEITVEPGSDAGDSEFHVFDVDAVNKQFCESEGLPIPTTSEERLACHLAAVRSWIGGRSYSEG